MAQFAHEQIETLQHPKHTKLEIKHYVCTYIYRECFVPFDKMGVLPSMLCDKRVAKHQSVLELVVVWRYAIA